MLSDHPTHILEIAAAEIVESRGGFWRRGGAMCRCPAHRDSSPSLSVRVGETSILFKCFAGCTAGEILHALRCEGQSVPVSRDRSTRGAALASESHRFLARSIWDAARPLEGGPGARYLAGRGIDMPSDRLRFHPAVPLGRGRLVRYRPAIVAAIEQTGEFVAIQRLFLDRMSDTLAADLEGARRMLGRPLRGAARLAPARIVLGLAEGVETALSASILLGIPVWAALGSERLAGIDIPHGVRQLVLLPDRDPPGVRAEIIARETYRALGLATATLWPWNGLKDWNDVLLRKGRRGEGRCGWPADWQTASLGDLP